jgi:hypothetical protein
MSSDCGSSCDSVDPTMEELLFDGIGSLETGREHHLNIVRLA